MIKFFRKIRYNLMGTGKTGKYFKYAIDEIILVIIGILIALQNNNILCNLQTEVDKRFNKYLALATSNLPNRTEITQNLNLNNILRR